MDKKIFILSFLFFLLMSADSFSAKEEAGLFWPPPPAEIKIFFVKSIYSAKDIGIKPGFFKKLKRVIIGEENDGLNKPVAVAVDRQKNIYVCDTGRPSLHIFKQKEKEYKRITAINKQELISPVAVAVSGEGLIFLADSKLKKVFCLNRKGLFQFSVGDSKKMLRPAGLAISKDKLYIADCAAHRILIFDLKGNFLGEFGKRGKGYGEFNYPTSISADNEGKIYVADTLNFRIQVFGSDNKFLYQLGQAGDTSGSFARPKGVGVDSFGHIYITDGLFDNLQIFSQKKEFLLNLGGAGHQEGEFWIPGGVAVDADNYIYVADSYNHRLQIFHYIGKE